jgi:hypothetical protein
MGRILSLNCHSEPFAAAQDKLREESRLWFRDLVQQRS